MNNLKKQKEYKNFTILTCKACGASIYEDLFDELCLDCLAEAGLLEDAWREEYEDYIQV